MSEPMPGPSTQADISPELVAELLDDFAKDFEAEKAEKNKLEMEKTKLKNLKYTSLSANYYKVFRRMQDTQQKPYILYDLLDFLKSEHSLWLRQNVKLFGIYSYDHTTGHHYLLSSVKGELVYRAKVMLEIYKLEKFPVVDSYNEIFGRVKRVKDVYRIIVDFFHQIREDCVDEYTELLKKQIAMLKNKYS